MVSNPIKTARQPVAPMLGTKRSKSLMPRNNMHPAIGTITAIVITTSRLAIARRARRKRRNTLVDGS